MRTFVEVIRDNSVYSDHAHCFVRMDGEERSISFPELWRWACQRANRLHELGLRKGDRVAIILPEPDDFVLAFIGAVTGGLVPVPMYPPLTLAKMEAYGKTVRHILAESGAKALITAPAMVGLLEEHLRESQDVRIILDSELQGELDGVQEPPCKVELDDLAFLQFTSGSTRQPKGVMVSHRNLAANAHAIMFDGLAATSQDKGVSWLPMFHDMGLIGFVIAPVFAQVQVKFLPTMNFIRRPAVWLDAIHRFRGTITFAPNFAYALATRAVRESDAKNWDLSCLKALGCGAEPIQEEILHAFCERFSAQRLNPNALLPCYGLAEATLAVTFSSLREPMRSDRVDSASIQQGYAKLANGKAAMTLVSCGKVFPGHRISIRDEKGESLEERRVGEVWVSGPSITHGYYRNAEATAECFQEGWLRTGDIGYLAEEQLYICGRAKDLIILNGKNFYPQDIERVVSEIRGIRQDQCVAFSRLDTAGKEECVVVAEARKGSRTTVQELHSSVRQRVRSALGVTVANVVLIKRGSLPKTSSGKVRRRETKMRLERQQLDLLEHEVLPKRVPRPRPSSSVSV